MAQNQKLVAMLVLCAVIAAAVQFPMVEAETFKKCYEDCQSGCMAGGSGFTFCEVKCDADCSEKETAAKLSGQGV